MATAGSAGSAQRNLTREEVIAKVLDSLRSVPSDVTRDEVITIVDGMANASGSYDPETVYIAGEECLRLWAGRDQVGLVCMLKLSQERFVDLQDKMQEAQAAAKAQMQAVREDMAELRGALVALQAKEKTKEEGQAENKDVQAEEQLTEAEVQTLKEEVAELQRAFAAFQAKEKTEKGGPQKDAKAKKQLSEEEQKEMKAWGHLKNYDEAFEVLCKAGDHNDLSNFASRSEEIRANHDVDKQVQSLLPRLYSDTLERLGSSVKLNYQPFHKDLDGLMAFHEQRKPLFDEKVNEVAAKTSGKAIIPAMKGRPRCESKAAFKYTDATGTSWHRCTDIVRATILYDDMKSMYAGLEALEELHQEKNLEIIEFNDRYLKPMPGNYRDLQLSVKIDSMVCELQLNTKVMAFVKEHAGHRNFEVSRELIAAVKESNSSRCDEILRWGTELLDAESIQEIINEDKKPVLHEAARSGNADLVSVFLEYKADVNLQNSDGQTALHQAMAGGYERAAWALICEGATFVADKQGTTPLMEGLLKLRVNPSDESLARAVSTVAQLCDVSEFDGLAGKMEELARQRLVQSSDLVVACKDANFEKVERLLRDWADPNSRADGLHVVHAALHGGRGDFDADRIKVLRRVLEFRADPDATTTSEGETRTALEVALRSSDRRAAPAGIAELVKDGARLMNRSIRTWLPPWTAEEIQRAEAQELVCHSLTTWLPSCGTEFVEVLKVDYSLMLKGCLLDFLLCRGYEAIKQFDLGEEKKDEMARLVANLLERRGHQWESTAVRANCSTKDVILSKTLEDASGGIRSASCSRQFLAAGGGDRKVRIYDLDQDSALTKTLEVAFGAIYSVSWNGQWLAAGGEDRKVRVYDAAQEFLLITSLEDALDEINSVSWGQQLLAAAGDDKTVRVYDSTQDFLLLATLGDAPKAMFSLSWGGPLLAAGGDDKKIRIYDSSQEFMLTRVLEDASNTILALAWNGPFLAAASRGMTVRIYDASKDFAVSKTLEDASDRIFSLSWSGHLLAAAGEDKKIRLYDSSQEFVLIQTLEDASGEIWAVAWRGRLLAAAGKDQKVRIYEEEKKRPVDAQVTDLWVRFVNLFVDCKGQQGDDALLHAAVACHAVAPQEDVDSLHESLQSAARAVAKQLRVLGQLDAAEEVLQNYAVEEFAVSKSLDDTSRINSVSWNQNVLAAGRHHETRIYDVLQEVALITTLHDSSSIRAVCWGQHFLAAGGGDHKLRIYGSSQDFPLIHTAADASSDITSISWNERFVAAASDDSKVRIYDSEQDFVLIRTLSNASSSILSVCWGGHLLATGGVDGKVRVYDSAQEFTVLKTISDASDWVRSVSWGGHLLAAAGKDKTVRVYNSLQEFVLIKALSDVSSTIWSLVWCDQLLAVGEYQNKIWIYDSSEEWTLIKILAMPSEVRSIGWCGRHLAVGLESGGVRVVDSQVRCGALEEDRLWELAVSKSEQK